MKAASMQDILRAVSLAACVAAVGPASAHHSNSMYEPVTTVTLNGSVKSFQWTNPHVVIWVMVQSEGGGDPQEWGVETTSPGVLTRNGWTHSSIKAGDRVSVEFKPLRDGSHGGFLKVITLLDTGQKLTASLAAAEAPAPK
jgi:Family of unknown function (DUF6152)